jgi:hypothetical protein
MSASAADAVCTAQMTVAANGTTTERTPDLLMMQACASAQELQVHIVLMANREALAANSDAGVCLEVSSAEVIERVPIRRDHSIAAG